MLTMNLQHEDTSPVDATAPDAMLTTIDNPWNPFTHWDDWYQFDTSNGYYSLALIARIANNSDELADSDQDYLYDDAVDEICYYNASGVHRKITESGEFVPSNFVEAVDTTAE